MRVRVRMSLLASLAAALLSGCGDSPTLPEIYDGIWVGSTAEDERVQLTIRGNRIVDFGIRFRIRGSETITCLAELPFDQTFDAPITNKTFELTFGGTGAFGNVPVTRVSGSFDTVRSLRGSYDSFTITDLCGDGTVTKAAGTFYANQ